MASRCNAGWLWPCGMIVSIILVSFSFGCREGDASDGLTVVSFGGAYQDAQREAVFRPFSEASGVQITEGTYDGDFALLRERATGASGWDLVSVESAVCERGAREGIFSEVDLGLGPEEFVAGTVKPTCIGHLVFSTVPAYKTSLDEQLDREITWADFWDLSAIPGMRALRNNPRGNLEIALLADGVPSTDLYPLDVDRAFRKLDELRPDLVFWESGAQPVQLLASGAVTLSSAYNGRIWDARETENLPLSHSWQGGLLEVEYWAIPKNSRNYDRALDFLRFSLAPTTQADFTNLIAYAPTNLGAMPNVEELIRRELPNFPEERLREQIVVDSSWWAEHEEEVTSRWESWRNR